MPHSIALVSFYVIVFTVAMFKQADQFEHLISPSIEVSKTDIDSSPKILHQ